jgi:CBS domain-containing protein
MQTVRDLLAGKSSEVWSIGPDATVYDAIALMSERGIGAVLVLDGAQLVGILSERDYARRVILKGKASRETRVREIMTTELIHVTHEKTIDDCMSIMTTARIRHLPVVHEGRLAGILSIGDIVKAMISEREAQIEQLEDYIKTGG